jgi:hypothetical protein
MLAHKTDFNVLTWNFLGELNPCFRRALLNLLNINSPVILILTKTRLGGPRAAELDKSFPFDGFLYTNTIGFGGVFGSYGSLMFWMWNIFALMNKRSMSQSR